ncbi:MAG TPA: cadherin repeat domain-containing protein, partial [Chromatiaceae bacterium]|nr:cadherin repeat domain-containing protein [Chromatiaceae bacterium]
PSYTPTLSGTDADLFEIATNNQLKLKDTNSADYETQSSYSVTVTATGVDSSPVSSNFTLTVTDVNEAPTDITLTSLTIEENSAAGTVVGDLSAADPDVGDTHNFSVVGGTGSNLFEINANNQLVVKSGVALIMKTQSSYSVTVTATDSGGLSKSQDFTIGVTDVVENTAPTAITLDSTTVAENAVASHIANISGVDPDEDDLTYSITGGSDAASFEIVNGMLHLAAGISADYETQSSYSVTLTATDLEGLTYTEAFTINITDVEEANTLYGSKSNDTLDGFSGYDIIDGGDGLDTAKYSVSSDAVSFSANDVGQLVIQNSANASLYTGKNASAVESDTLVSMERIQFSDKNYALDLDGNAGVAAKAIITCFGQDSLASYMSAGLTLADGGSTLDEICELVAGMGYIESIKGISTNSAFVDFIFENVVGRSPNLMESSMYTAYLDDGAYTKGSLLTLAANTSLVDKLLTESAVDLSGVAGSADGEILALQYDIGLG